MQSLSVSRARVACLRLTCRRQDVVLACLENKCDVNARDFAGYTALHECCASGHLEIARTLLAHGADPNASAARGIRVLHDAIESDRLQVVRLLLSYGADATISTYKGTTPLDLAPSKAMRQLLRGFLADLNGDAAVPRWRVSRDEDVLAEAAPEAEEEPLLTELDVEIEESEVAMCDTFTLDGETLVRVTDVARHLGMSRHEFSRRHPHLRLLSLSREHFESRVTCNQLLGCRDARTSRVELLRLEEEVREMLGIERTRVPGRTRGEREKRGKPAL